MKQTRSAVLGVFVLILFLVIWMYRRHSSDAELSSFPLLRPNPSTSPTANDSLCSIQNATLGFQQILALNLPERTDHRDGLVLAAAVSDISIDFIKGVRGDLVSPKALPVVHAEDLSLGVIGSWRAHVTALSRVVEGGYSTALILEDDVDWDVRLKNLLQEFALSSSYLLQDDMKQPPRTTRLQDVRLLSSPKMSPYGDHWDVLWLGHCGMSISSDSNMVIHEKDLSVPLVEHLKIWDEEAISPLQDYPPHTRLVMRQNDGVCSLAYAVSQSGARKLLLQVGLQRLEGAFDIMLRQFCTSTNGEGALVCLTVLPQLFDHHRQAGPKNADSDINPSTGQFRQEAYTYNIRESVRRNMERILKGDTNYTDQWPDSAATSYQRSD